MLLLIKEMFQGHCKVCRRREKDVQENQEDEEEGSEKGGQENAGKGNQEREEKGSKKDKQDDRKIQKLIKSGESVEIKIV